MSITPSLLGSISSPWLPVNPSTTRNVCGDPKKSRPGTPTSPEPRFGFWSLPIRTKPFSSAVAALRSIAKSMVPGSNSPEITKSVLPARDAPGVVKSSTKFDVSSEEPLEEMRYSLIATATGAPPPPPPVSSCKGNGFDAVAFVVTPSSALGPLKVHSFTSKTVLGPSAIAREAQPS